MYYNPTYKEIKRRYQNTPIDIWVVSHGGVGTNTIANFLNKKFAIRNELWEKYLCHHQNPISLKSKGVMKCIYLWGNPIISLYSQYKRGLIQINATKVSGLYREYLNWEEFLNSDESYFPIERQFDNWNTAYSGVEILSMNYDTIFENIDVLFDFIGCEIPNPPNRKERKIKNIPYLKEFENKYDKLLDKMEKIKKYKFYV